MNERTDEEKRRILQERLAQIKQKDTKSISSTEEEIVTVKEEPNQTIRKRSFKWTSYIIIITTILCIFYIYNNFNDFNLDSKKEITIEDDNYINWNKTNIKGNYIAVIATYQDESSAKAYVNNLTIKGFKCDYLSLPLDNKDKKIFKVYLGGYESIEETNQWVKNIDKDYKIINLVKS